MFSTIKNLFKPKEVRSQPSIIDFTTINNAGLGLERTLSGQSLTNERQLEISSFWAATAHKSETIGKLRKPIMRKVDDLHWQHEPQHPLEYLFNVSPNKYQTAPFFWRFVVTQLCVYGNAYVRLDFGPDGRLEQAIPIPSRYCLAYWNKEKEERYFVVMDSPYTQEQTLPEYRCIHISGLSLNGVLGENPIVYCRQSYGLTLAAERFGASWLGRSINLSSYFTTPTELGDNGRQNLKESAKAYKGGDQAGGMPVFEQGLEIKTPALPDNSSSQWLELRQHQIDEVANFCKIPAYKLGSARQHNTFANLEQEGLNYCRETIAGITAELDAEFTRKIFLHSEQGQYRLEIALADLLKGDTTSQVANVTALVAAGIQTPNEGRRELGLPPMPGGDDLRLPLNTEPGSEVDEPKEDPEIVGESADDTPAT